jgi:hypothetical protein
MRLLLTIQPASRTALAALLQPQRGREREKASEKGPQGELVVARCRSGEALGGAALSNHVTGPPLGDPEPLGEDLNGPPAAIRG